jgi:hypothetical protein
MEDEVSVSECSDGREIRAFRGSDGKRVYGRAAMSVKANVLEGHNGRESKCMQGQRWAWKRVYARTATGAQACLLEDHDGRESK